MRALVMTALAISLAFGCEVHSYAEEANLGSVCVGDVPPPTPGPKSLGNATGGNKVSKYSIQIDKLSRTEACADSSIRIGGIPLAGKHVVKIFGDGKQVESFTFDYTTFKADALCLWFNPLYETWNLWTEKDARGICRCKQLPK